MRKPEKLILMTMIIISCKKPYDPPVVNSNSNYLVVEGQINTGSDSTVIKLSRTVNISNKFTLNPEVDAVVTIESDQNASFQLTGTGGGYYVAAGLNLDNSRKYRLRIKTANEVYHSDFVAVANSPAIDTVSRTFENDGVRFYVSTHDPNNNTHFYRWDYRETWVIHSNYYSFYKSNGDSVIDRNLMNDEVYQCWRSDTANGINVASSSHLQKDVVSNNPLTFVSAASEKLSAKYSIVAAQSAPTNSAYSILVRQYALTADAYTFWANLKKNTELLGSVFDAQPSQLQGNIHSETTPAEPVIGYISAGTVTSKRIFIKNQEVPAGWASPPAFNNCKLDTLFLSWYAPGATVPLNQENEYFNYNKGNLYSNRLIPVVAIWNQQLGTIIGHTGSTPECVDCTLRGTNKQPEYWR
ncbi:DUF4249 domain-containing protein [uncultured Mucilaginibacter sp.]|uniref:DUF4249 domain-containing protein n=1 Tax=uncultured Mucilaginibacter sp. TaxID=797541 RepID=UPI0025E2BF77|nr:DUF4249 domain-containing protein [uncultured Mucilaginibacter sp.]